MAHKNAKALKSYLGSDNNYVALAEQIKRHIYAGDQQEVRDFLTQAEEISTLHSVAKCKIIYEDHSLCIALAKLIGPRFLSAIPPEGHSKYFSGAVREYFAQTLNLAPEKDLSHVRWLLSSNIPALAYEGMPSEEVFELIDWLGELMQEADKPNEYYSLLKTLENPAELILIAKSHQRLREIAIKCHAGRLKSPISSHWAIWHDFLKENPALILKCDISDVDLFVWLFDCKPHLGLQIAKKLIHYYGKYDQENYDHYKLQLDTLIANNQSIFLSAMKASIPVPIVFVELVLEKNYPEIKPHLLWPVYHSHALDHIYQVGDYSPVIHQILRDQPEAITTLETEDLEHLVSKLPSDILTLILPTLIAPLKSSSSKKLRKAIVDAVIKLAPMQLLDAGWLRLKNKNLRLVCLDILLAHPDRAAAAPLLKQLSDTGELDLGSISLIAEHLEKYCPDLCNRPQLAAPEIQLADLEVQALGVKRIAATVKHFASPIIIALMQPLSEKTAQVVLHLAATAMQDLPPLALALLAQIPANSRTALERALIAQWIAAECDPKFNWVFKLVSTVTDDQLAEQLTEAVFAWGKTKPQRAIIAIEHLMTMDIACTTTRANKIIACKTFKSSVRLAARSAFSRAQKRAIISLEQQDEFTPDFGLLKGITLTVGNNSYNLLLQGDLTLLIQDINGKLSKTLPATRDSLLKNTWELACEHISILTSSIKNFRKQQIVRLTSAFIAGKYWPCERWQLLFVAHPLMRIICHSLVWQSIEDGRSFRIAEDFSLLDVQDNNIKLAAQTHVRLWHPVHATAEETLQWQAHLSDYKLDAIIDQVGAPTQLPPNKYLKDDLLLAPPKLYIAQEQLVDLLKKWHYIEGEIYKADESVGISCHELPLPPLQKTAQLNYGFFPAYLSLDYLIRINSIQIIGDDKCVAAELPSALLATLWQHMNLMIAKSTRQKR